LGGKVLGRFFENGSTSIDEGGRKGWSGGFGCEGEFSRGHLENPISQRGELVSMGNREDGEFPFVPEFLENFEDFLFG
jgi:hypothetical protein